MTDSEQSEFLNNILVYLRDSNTHLTAMQIFLPIIKPLSATHTSMLSAIDKLKKDGYISTIDDIVGAEYQYYISVDGTFFINRGGYIYETNPGLMTDEIIAMNDDLEIEIINRSEHPDKFIETTQVKPVDVSTYTTIDAAFEEIQFVDDFSYGNMKTVLAEYFTNGNIPTDFADIQFSRINRKKIGSKFNQLHKKFNKPIGLDFCKFCVRNINLWKTTTIEDETNFRNSRIYKDCHDNSF